MKYPRLLLSLGIFLTLFTPHTAWGAKRIPPALWDKVFSGNKFDTASVNALVKVSDKYWDYSRDSIQKYNPLFLERERIYKEARFTYGLFHVYALLGGNFKLLYNQARSAAYYFQALKVAEEMGNTDMINWVRRELGLLYFIQSGWQHALHYFNPLLEYEERTQQNISKLNQYRYLAGLCHVRLGQPRKALKLLQAAYNWALANQDTQRRLEYGTGYAAAQLATGDTAAAGALYETLLETGHSWKDADPVFFATVYIGKARIALSDPDKYQLSRDYASMALRITEGKIGYNMPRIEAGQILYLIYKTMGRSDSAVYFLEQWTRQKDSLESTENTAVMSLMQATHDFDKREASLRTVERQKRLVIWIVVGVLGLLGLIVLFFYRSLSMQKQRTEDLLENILPRETIAELKTYGQAIPRIHDEVTILFCDVRSFTSIAESMSPASLVALLDHYFRGFDEIVADLGLEKIKTIGDAYMVAGGLHEDSGNAETVVEAAMRMLHFAEKNRSDLETAHGSSFHFRVGVHSGSVISGVVGRDKYAYDIWGDAVNVAARMEQNSEEGKINVSGETWERVAHQYHGIYRGKIAAKNKGEIDMYFVESRLAVG